MSNPLLLDIVTYLTNKQVIDGDGVDTFRDFIPEMPEDLIAITEYKGSPMSSFESASHRSVQILVRNKDADLARSKCLDIFRAIQENLDGSSRIDFTEDRWGQVSLRQTPYRFDTDNSDRVTYGFNIGITTTID